ncbi:energy transducer TonB family protein [Stappia indica]|uniref:TonB family protein n=1 Tax=Stappia indica TaxID=538381 RepID=A0A857CDI7_9HYPH|nr:energy transducer TonB [Stappia indica]QGZ37143.1 TonB family protein [Stappia indica]
MKLRPHHVAAALMISTAVHASAVAVIMHESSGVQIEGGGSVLSAELGDAFVDALQAGADGEHTEVTSETSEVVTPIDAPEGEKPVEHATALEESLSEEATAPDVPHSEAVPPEEVVEAVEPPAEPTPVASETAEPLSQTAETTPAEETVEALPMEMAALAPGIVATAVPTAVEQAAEVAEAAPVQASVSPVEAQPTPSTERLEAVAAVPMPQARPKDLKIAEVRREAPARKADTVKRQKEKAASVRSKKTTSGHGGNSNATAKAGGSRNVGKSKEFGNADASNYMGKVQSRLERAKRRGRVGRQRGMAVVTFVVASNGSLAGARLVKSSGNETIDRAALSTVQRAQPFPPIPPEARRKNWSFTSEIKFE